MTRVSQMDAISANSASENASPKRSDFRFIDAMMDVARRIWPNKTAANLAAVTNVSERAAQFWLAGHTGPTLSAARELLRSDRGFEFLIAYLGDDCDAAWFRRCKLHHEIVGTGRGLRQQSKMLERLKAAQQQLADIDDS